MVLRGTALFVPAGEGEPFLFVRGGETETALFVRREGRGGSVPSRWKSDALPAMVWCETPAPAARSSVQSIDWRRCEKTRRRCLHCAYHLRGFASRLLPSRCWR